MYRSPVLSLLHPGQIGGVSDAFTTTSTNLRAQLDALHANAVLQNIAFFGAGRFVNSSADAVSGIIRDAGGLAVELPAVIGTTKIVYLVGGIAFTLDELATYTTGEFGGLILLDNVPAAGVWYGYLQLDFDEDDGYSLSATWTSSADTTKRRSGGMCIGKVTTDADSITAIDPAPADLIFSMSFLQARLTALSASGGSGSGGGGSVLFATQLPISEDDATDTKTYIDERLNDIETTLGKLEGAADQMPAPVDQLADEIAINRLSVGDVNPHAIERGQISVIGATFGHGQDDTPDYTPDTNDPLELPFHQTTGLFGP